MYKKLFEGKWNNSQLAEWFGIADCTFRHSKKKRLEELRNFAEFYEEKGKIVITKVLVEEYSKGQRPIEFIESKVDEIWSPTGLDSCSRVSKAICAKYPNDITIANSTAYAYTRECRNILYGKPFQNEGKLGHCEYLWCKKFGQDEDAVYVPFTPEEELIKKDLILKYFGTASEKQIFVEGMILKGEITREEAWDVLSELTGMSEYTFYSFLRDLGAAVGATVVRGTMVERNAFSYVDDESNIPFVDDEYPLLAE